ncbi:septum site-determining protein MinC [Mangrovibacillus cuniculi]|uniref:Probable septum site-determining protein MinC n=1 Tax=Mangrovibacillus cuniculi TaxID=2593652 RepID=A0A7S8HFS5_9BACI|nr:septum site-determining protein MinC [Mangrovibacillus cuniculi]QPC47047.1 septum site-determining protein MinC [Mangrovibacillus cuniculi]
MKKTQLVMIKGTKEGLNLHLHDKCSIHELKDELISKLTQHGTAVKEQDQHATLVRVHVGNRYLAKEEEKELNELIESTGHVKVDSIHSNVISLDEAKKRSEESTIHSISSFVRSGQVVTIRGDVLLIGDVNPGGTLRATGNIYIMGSLKGIAHAGCEGDSEAVIVASSMRPMQLRIAEQIHRAPDHKETEIGGMECAYLDEEEHMVVDRLQVLKTIRPNLTRFKGGF